jgi:hypothetical protein
VLFNDASGRDRDAERVFLFVDLSVLEYVGLAFDEFGVGTVLGGRSLLVDHADDLISEFIDEDKLGAVSTALTCEMADAVDAAQDAETVHALVQVADVEVGVGYLGF